MDSTEIGALQSALRRLCSQEAVRAARRAASDPNGTGDAGRAAVDEGLVAMGLPLMLLPEKRGGAGGDLGDLSMVLSELGRHAIASDLIDDGVASYVIGHATAPVARQIAAQLVGGARVAVDDGYFSFAHTAESPGAGAAQVHVTRWSRDEPLGVIATTEGRHGVVPAWFPWAALAVVEELRDPAGMLRLSLRVPDRALGVSLAEPDALFGRASALARLASTAFLLGVGDGIRDLVVDYGRLRESFGRLIGSYQAFKQRCAEDWVSSTVLAALLRECVDLWQHDDPSTDGLVSAAAGMACESASQAGSHGILLHGAIGFTWEHDAHLYLRSALSAAARLGGATSQFERAGRALGLAGPTV